MRFNRFQFEGFNHGFEPEGVELLATVAFYIMINVVDQVPDQYQPECIKTAEEKSFKPAEFLQPFRVIPDQVINRFGNGSEDDGEYQRKYDEINDLLFDRLFKHLEKKDVQAHDMGKNQPKYTGKQ